MIRSLKDIQGSLGDGLSGRLIALGVSASVAALESHRLARLLMRHGAEVQVLLTPAAAGMVSAQALHWATGNPVITELTGRAEHLDLCGADGRASALLVAPATANTVGKMALGLDDNCVTTTATTALGSGLPVLVAPGMHEPMYRHPVVGENLARLEVLGVRLVAPRIEEGKAKMADCEEILAALLAALAPRTLAGRRVLVTAGPTREPLDEVRFFTNPSSGRMGVELAREALSRGAEVTLVYGPGSVPPPPRARVIRVTTAAEMAAAVFEELVSRPPDVFLGVAAVADYAPESPAAGKLPTSAGALELRLVPTPKILDRVREHCPGAFLVGFKAEATADVASLLEAARARLGTARADLMVANRVGQGLGFESERNEVWLVRPEGEPVHLTPAHKSRLAAPIWDHIQEGLR